MLIKLADTQERFQQKRILFHAVFGGRNIGKIKDKNQFWALLLRFHIHKEAFCFWYSRVLTQQASDL